MRFECGFEKWRWSTDQKNECLPDLIRASQPLPSKPEGSETMGGTKFGHTSSVAAARQP
jgi:hypothetical protein